MVSWILQYLIVVGMVMTYQWIGFTYAESILEEPLKKNGRYMLCALVNLFIMGMYYEVKVPHFMYYYLGFVVVCIEFRSIAKAHLRQIICGAAIFMMHISLVHIGVTVFLSAWYKVAPLSVLASRWMAVQCTSMTFAVLILILYVVKKLIPTSNIKKISTTPVYAKMISIVTLAMLALSSFDAWILITNEGYPELVLIALSNVFIQVVLFYFIFIYSMQLADMNVYKHKFYAMQSSYAAVRAKKEGIEEKLVKDSLTGLYNRKFIYAALERFCEKGEAAFGVLFIDVNGLKYVNDTLGHCMGDRYIVKVSEAIKEGVQEEDFAARIGGDEFLVILQVASEAVMAERVEQMKACIKLQNEAESVLEMAMSIGAIWVDESLQERGATAVLTYADERMRREKEKFYHKVGGC